MSKDIIEKNSEYWKHLTKNGEFPMPLFMNLIDNGKRYEKYFVIQEIEPGIFEKTISKDYK